MSKSAISINNLTKVYREGLRREEVKAVDGLSVDIDEGSVVGLIGPNGAGKSTTIYCILGLLIPDEGSVKIFDQSPQSKEARERLGFQSEIFHTYNFLKPKQALRFYGKLSNLSDEAIDQRIDYHLERLGLMHASNRKVGSFSKGMKQRLGIVQSLLHDPDLLILDEPFTGLDPEGRQKIAQIVQEERNNGKTIFFSSHILSDIERLCDEVVIIRKGQVVLSGRLSEITDSEGRWSISVKGWEDIHSQQLEDWELTVNEHPTTTEIICSGETKDNLLSRLLEMPVEIVGLRAVSQSLEELYMELEEKDQPAE